jgi:hypothetical protein
MIDFDHIRVKVSIGESFKKCGRGAQAAVGRSFAEPTISPFGADLHPAID